MYQIDDKTFETMAEFNAYWQENVRDKARDAIADLKPTYSKVMLFKAMTDEEFSTFQTVKAMQSDRKQAVFDNATVLDSADDDFIDFQMLMLGTFGNERAEELLNAAKL